MTNVTKPHLRKVIRTAFVPDKDSPYAQLRPGEPLLKERNPLVKAISEHLEKQERRRHGGKD